MGPRLSPPAIGSPTVCRNPVSAPPGPGAAGPWDFAPPFIASSARGGGRRPAAIGRGHVSACQRPVTGKPLIGLVK